MFLNFINRHRLLLLLIILFVFLRLPSLFEPFWYGDEGIYLVIGQALRRGVVLYRQIHDNKPPTLYYLAALGQTVFGFRLLLALWMVPTLYFFYQLTRQLFSPKIASLSLFLFLILSSIPLFEGNIANAEIFMLLPTIIAVYLIFIKSSFFKILLAGLLLGFAFTIKVPVAVEFGFLFLWSIFDLSNFNFQKIKILPLLARLIIFFVAFLLPIFLYFIYFLSQDAVNEFLFSALFQNFGYLSSWATGSHSGSASSGGLLSRAIILVFSWLLIFVLLVKKYLTRSFAFLLFWLCATVFGALLSTRPYPHYLIQVVPPLVLIIAFIFEKKSRLLFRGLASVVLCVLAFLFFHYHFYTYGVIRYYQNFYSYAVGLKTSTDYVSYFGSAILPSYEISDYIKTHSSSTDKIFVWGDNPYIYALSDRLPADKYTVAYHIVDFNQYHFVADQLKVNYPLFIVYFPQPGRPYPELDTFIHRYYQPVKTFADAIIFQRLN